MKTFWTALLLTVALGAILINPGARDGIIGCLAGDRYSMDSFCFDMNAWCSAECGNWGYRFNGTTEGCKCYCDSGGFVSACSGFYYKPEGGARVNITGKEVCEYSNGTTEPCGFTLGVYDTNGTADWHN